MEEDYIDISKVGTGGLTGLPPVYEQQSDEPSEDLGYTLEDFNNYIDLNNQRLQNMSFNQLISRPQQAEEQVGLESMERGVGDSKYDRNITNMSQLEDLNEFRATQQSGAAQIANGIGKMATTFGTTFLSNTIGSMAGLTQGLVNVFDGDEKTTFLNGMWNNKVNQALADFNSRMEEAMPNYYTEYERTQPWYKQIFTANFLGDKLIKNAGFMMGSAASMVTFGEIGAALGITGALTKGVVPWVLNNFLSSSGEASIEAIQSIKENEKAMNFNLDNFTKQRSQDIENQYVIDLTSGINPDLAFQRYNQSKSALNVEIQNYKAQMAKELSSAGNAVYGMNVVALMLTNGINMGSFLKGGFKNASHIFDKAVFKIGEKSGAIRDFTTKELSEAMLKGTLRADAEEIKRGALKVGGRWLANSAAEGFQEGVQSQISTTNEILTQSRMNKYALDNNLTDAFMNPATTDQYIDYATASLKSWDEQFGSIASPGWEEVFIGALSAGLGMPAGHIENNVRKDSHLEKRFKFGWRGGVAEAIEDVYGDNRRLKMLAETLNQRLQDPEQIKIIRNAIGNLSVESAKDQAIELQDIRSYKNLEIAQAVMNSLYFKEAGLLDAYLGVYEEFAKGISDEELNEIYMATYNIDTDESPLSDEQREDVRRKYQDKARSTVNKIRNILKNNDEIRAEFMDKFDEYHAEEAITELVYRKSLYDDTVRRREELESQLEEIQDNEDHISQIQRAELRRSIAQLEKQAEQLDQFIKHAIENPEQYQEEIDKVREERARYYVSRHGEAARMAYAKASDMNQIADIYYRGEIETRDEILNQAINEVEDKQQKQRLEEFKRFKENVDVMYDFVDETYDAIGTSEGVNRMKSLVKDTLDQIVIDALSDEDYLLNTISDRLGQKIVEIENEIYDRENGPYLYDEFGRYIQIRDMDRLMMLQHLQGLFQDIKDTIDDVNDARDTGRKSERAKSDEDWEAMTDEEVGAALFGEEEPAEQPKEKEEITEEFEEETGTATLSEEEPVEKPVGQTVSQTEQEQSVENVEVPESDVESEVQNQEEPKEVVEQPKEVVTENQVVEEEEEPRIIEDYELQQQAVQGEIPNEVSEDYNNGDNVQANDSLKGNNFAPYTTNGLREGKLIEVPDRQKTISQSDKVRIQRFIDKYMSKWLDATKNKSQRIYFITHDEHPEIIYLAVKKGEYTDFIKNYSDLLVVGANNEYNVSDDYIIIGTLGYYNPGKNPTKSQLASSNAQKRSFGIIRDGLFKEHEGFEGYHVSKYTTTVKGFTDGFKIHDRSKKNSLRDLLNGDMREFTNPFGLSEDSLKVSYITGTEEQGYIEKFIRFNSSDRRIPLTPEAMQAGRVFVYVPTNRGYYMPMFVETMRFNDWFDDNRDTDLAKDIIKTLKNLAESHPGEDGRSNSLKDLYNLLVFSGDDYLAFVDIKRKNKITGKQEVIGGVVRQGSGLGSRVLYKQFVDYMEVVGLADIDQIQGEEPEVVNEKFEILLNAIYQINPRIALNSALLDTNIGYYIDSNVLQTDFEVLGTIGSSFYVNPLDSNMNVIESNVNDGFKNETTSSQRQDNDVAVYVPTVVNGKTVSAQYWFDPTQNKLYDAEKIEIPYQGNEDLYLISSVVYGEMTGAAIPSFTIGDTKYFELKLGDKVVKKNVRSYEVLSESDKQDYFNKKQKLIEQERKRKEKEEAEQTASQTTEDTHDTSDLIATEQEPTGVFSEALDAVRKIYVGGELYFNPNISGIEAWEQLKTNGVTPEDIYNALPVTSGEFHDYLQRAYDYITKQQSSEEIDKQVMDFIEKAVSLSLESDEENRKMKDIKMQLGDDESALYEFAKQLVADIDDLNLNDALHALLRQIYRKPSFNDNYADFRQAVLNLEDETVQKDILNCK